jgi:hypothetical protein
MGTSISSYYKKNKLAREQNEQLIKLNLKLKFENEQLTKTNKILEDKRNSLIKLDVREFINTKYLIIKQPYKYSLKLKENLLSNDINIFSDFFELVTFKDSKGYLQYSINDDMIVQNTMRKYNIKIDEYCIIKTKDDGLISVVNYTFIQEYMNKWMNLNIKRITKFDNVLILTYEKHKDPVKDINQEIF